MVETGLADLGDGHQLGVLTKQDLLRLLLWSIILPCKYGYEPEGAAVRQLVRRVKPMLSPVEAITLAEQIDSCYFDAEEWAVLAGELKEWANRPLFKQGRE